MANVSSSNGLEKRPKLRFPGFDEPLVKFEIGNACEQLKETIDPRTTPTKFYAEYSMPAFDNNRKVARVQGKDMNSARKIMSKPCVLINKLNVRKKRIWLVEHPEKNAVSSTEFVPLTSTMMSLGYLNYVALTDRFTNYMLNCSSGSSNSQKRVTPDDIMDYVITVPSLLEQVRVASFLETIDSKIQAQQDLIELLKKYKRGAVQKLFSEMDMKQWELVQLKDVVNIFDGTHQTPNYKTTGVRFISVENILNPLATQKYISEDDYQKEFKVHPEYGDVLMTRIGDIGRTCYVNFVSDMAYYVSLALFKCSSKIDGRYLAAYISTNDFQKELWERTLHIAFPKKINTGEIGECYIHLPSRERQIVIASYLDVIEKKIQLAEKQLNLMQLIKTGLMQQLFI